MNRRTILKYAAGISAWWSGEAAAKEFMRPMNERLEVLSKELEVEQAIIADATDEISNALPLVHINLSDRIVLYRQSKPYPSNFEIVDGEGEVVKEVVQAINEREGWIEIVNPSKSTLASSTTVIHGNYRVVGMPASDRIEHNRIHDDGVYDLAAVRDDNGILQRWMKIPKKHD